MQTYVPSYLGIGIFDVNAVGFFLPIEKMLLTGRLYLDMIVPDILEAMLF